jgi:dual specificity phosphatase 12
MKQQRLAPDEAFSMIQDTLPLFNLTVNFSRSLDLYYACGYLPTREHPVVYEWLKSERSENSFSASRNSDSSPGYAKRPTGSIVSCQTDYTSASRSVGEKFSSYTTPSLQECPPSLTSPTPLTRRTSISSSNFNVRHVTRSSEMNFRARAEDILSNTGFDLSGFADSLKEIENTRTKNSTGGINASRQEKQRVAESLLYC